MVMVRPQLPVAPPLATVAVPPALALSVNAHCNGAYVGVSVLSVVTANEYGVAVLPSDQLTNPKFAIGTTCTVTDRPHVPVAVPLMSVAIPPAPWLSVSVHCATPKFATIVRSLFNTNVNGFNIEIAAPSSVKFAKPNDMPGFA